MTPPAPAFVVAVAAPLFIHGEDVGGAHAHRRAARVRHKDDGDERRRRARLEQLRGGPNAAGGGRAANAWSGVERPDA